MIHRTPRDKSMRGDDHRIANRMRRYFAPASTFPPPNSPRGATGNRNVAISSQNSPNSAPTDAAVIQFIPGGTVATAKWTFATKFNGPPIVKAIAIGTSATGLPQEISIAGSLYKGNSGVTFQSTDPNDQRFLHVTAIGNPT